MDAEIEQNLVQMEAKLSTDGWETFAIKYLIKDGSYRIEKMPLPNDVPLEKLAEQQSSPDVDSFVPTYIQAWNGELYSEMVMPESDGSTDVKEREGTSMLTEPKDAAQSFAALAYDDKGTFPKFIQYARSEAARSSFLEDMANKGCPATTVETETPEGKAITLRLGHPNSVGLKAEYVVLPEKGYCVYSSQMKFANVVRMQAEYRNFIRTSAGFWVPTHISIETFDLDEKTAVPYLSVKEELVAFENPQTNLGLEDELFDLTSDERWDKLQKSNYLLPQGDPYLDVSGIDNPGSNDRGAAPRGKKTLKRVD